MLTIRRIIAIVALVIMALFSIQNLEAIDIAFLSWKISVPTVAVIIVSYLLGMATGWGIFGFVRKSMKAERAARTESSQPKS